MPAGASPALLLTGAYCFAYVAAETLPPMFGPTLGYLATSTGLTMSELSTMPSVFSAGAVAGGLAGGMVFDSVRHIRAANMVLCATLVGCAVFNVLTPAATTLAALSTWNLGLG